MKLNIKYLFIYIYIICLYICLYIYKMFIDNVEINLTKKLRLLENNT